MDTTDNKVTQYDWAFSSEHNSPFLISLIIIVISLIIIICFVQNKKIILFIELEPR